MKRLLSLASAVLFVVCCGLFGASEAASSSAVNFKDNNLPPATRSELGRLRSVTAKYLDISQAIQDGYIDIDVFVPGQGFHFLRPDFLDDHFQLDKPELLVYSPDPFKNRLRLVAIEYAAPVSLLANPPEGFTGNADVWHHNEDFGLWTLHCWVWLENPNGMFEMFNPRVP